MLASTFRQAWPRSLLAKGLRKQLVLKISMINGAVE